MPRPVIAGFLAMALGFAGLPLLSIAFFSQGAGSAEKPITTLQSFENPAPDNEPAEQAAFRVGEGSGCTEEASPEPIT
jgi:hypothetical protein